MENVRVPNHWMKMYHMHVAVLLEEAARERPEPERPASPPNVRPRPSPRVWLSPSDPLSSHFQCIELRPEVYVFDTNGTLLLCFIF